MKKLLSLVLALTMVLGISAFTTAGATELTDINTWELASSEIQSFCYQHTQVATDLRVLANCLENLLTSDIHGNRIPNLAETVDSGDGSVWTFTLHDGINWVNQQGEIMAPVVAEDWLWGLEFTLNYAKNEGINTSMPSVMIKGAADYYKYTKELAQTEGVEAAKALGLEKFKEMVGVSAPDDKTIIYELLAKLPYFDSIVAGNSTSPISGKLLEQLGPDGYLAVMPDTMWYNGAYTITEYVAGNSKTLTKNPNYWNKDAQVFNSVTWHMVESQEAAFQLFTTGEVDYTTLTASQLSTIYNNPSNEWYPYLVEARPTAFSYSFHFCYAKLNEDGTPDVNWNTAIANAAFRKAMYYGLDLTDYLALNNFVNPLSCENYVYTANNVVSNSAGRDYTMMVLDELGMTYDRETYNRFDPEKAAAYKAQAIEELTAQGVTFPVVMDYYVQGSNQTKVDEANVLKQIFADFLGEDFITFNIKSYVSSLAQEVRNPRLAAVYINGWGADFNDPVNFLGQETIGDDNAWYSMYYSNANDITDPELIAIYQTFTDMVNEGAAIVTDNDARYAAFAKAEAYFVENALTIPLKIDISWKLTTWNDYTHPTSRFTNMDTKMEAYTTEEYATFKTMYENGEY